MNSQVHKINKTLIVGWLITVAILFLAYAGEVVKGERSVLYFVVFMLITAVPPFICLGLYLRKPDMKSLRYYIVVGFFIMYVFSMITGSTSMIFCYILPLLSVLVLYHQPKLIVYTGIASVIVNVISICHKAYMGEMTLQNSKDVEIQMGMLVLCFVGASAAASLYDKITRQNEAYLAMLDEKNGQIGKMTLQTITTIANAIDARDEYTKGHSQRVSEYTAAIAQRLGYSEYEVREIRSIALLHDIGKIGIPDAVLNKPGKLTEEEYQLMRKHTVIGSEILKDIEMIPGIDIGAKYHHERYDGKGYPDGLRGEEIPYIARIIAVADAYDAMTSNRVYRPRLSDEKVLQELKAGEGKQFDPEILKVFLELVESKQFEEIGADFSTKRDMNDVTNILNLIMEKREEQYAQSIQFDDLTHTYNRSYGEKLIVDALKQGKGCLVLFDLDHFKVVNDVSGFVTGDIFLKVVAQCIRHMSDERIISRYGGDEFVVFFNDITTEAQAVHAMDAFMEELSTEVRERKALEGLSVSAGIVLCTKKTESLNDLLLKADKALYVAKQQGGGKYYFHHQEHELVESGKFSRVDLNHLIAAVKNKGAYDGAFQVSYPEFGRIYELIRKIADRNEQSIQVLMFTVLPNDGASVTVEEREEAMEILECAIIASVRGVDVTTRYSSTQRIVLLMNLTEDQLSIVTERIMREFYRMHGHKKLSVYYDAADLGQIEKE